MPSTTIGSSTTSFMPLSSRSATRAVGGRLGRRSRLRSSTGSVEASAAPRIGGLQPGEAEQEPAGQRDEHRGNQRARAEHQQGETALRPTSPMSIAMASLNSTSTSARVAIDWSVGDSSVRLIRPSPAGPSSGAEDQEDADLRQPAALDDARRAATPPG